MSEANAFYCKADNLSQTLLYIYKLAMLPKALGLYSQKR